MSTDTEANAAIATALLDSIEGRIVTLASKPGELAFFVGNDVYVNVVVERCGRVIEAHVSCAGALNKALFVGEVAVNMDMTAMFVANFNGRQ